MLGFESRNAGITYRFGTGTTGKGTDNSLTDSRGPVLRAQTSSHQIFAPFHGLGEGKCR